MAQWKRASFRVDAGTSGFIYISDSDRTVPAELGKESQAFSCVEERNSACLSSSSRDDRTLVNLCLESACFSTLCMGMSVPLRVVPSPTGLPWKRGPGLRAFSRADRGIGGVRHVAPPTWFVSNFLVRPASSLGAPGRSEALADKAGESTLLSRSGGEKGHR